METRRTGRVSAFQVKVISGKDQKNEKKNFDNESKKNENSSRRKTRKRLRSSRSKSREKFSEIDTPNASDVDSEKEDDGQVSRNKCKQPRLENEEAIEKSSGGKKSTNKKKSKGLDKDKDNKISGKKKDNEILKLDDNKKIDLNVIEVDNTNSNVSSKPRKRRSEERKLKEIQTQNEEEKDELAGNSTNASDLSWQELGSPRNHSETSSPRSSNGKSQEVDKGLQENVDGGGLDDAVPTEKRPAALETADGVIIVLPHLTQHLVKGKAKLQCLSGTVNIMGYNLSPSETMYELHSPECNSLVTMTTVNAEPELSLTIDNVKCFINDKKVDNFIKNILMTRQPSVVLKVQKLDYSACDFLTGFLPFTEMFKIQGDGSQLNKKLLPLGVTLPLKSDLPSLEIPEELNNVMAEWKAAIEKTWKDAPVLLVCGGKNSGKSTTSRILLNTSLNSLDHVYYLECDIGQTEFTPAGCVSLHKVAVPVFGAPFCHQRQPLCCYHVGGLSPKDDPDYCIDCIRRCVQCYRQTDKPAPLIVNTMGWMKGLGLQLLVDTTRLISPSHIVQLMSLQRWQNASPLTGEFQFETSWTDLSVIKPGWMNEAKLMKDTKMYLLDCPPSATRMPSKFQAVDHRNLSLLAHLGDGLEPGSTLTSMTPYCIRWQDVAVHVCGVAVPESQIMYAINASLVALCETKMKKTKKYTDDGPMFFPELPPCKWLGYGIVRGIDPARKTMYIVTSLSLDRLANVNTIVKGAVTIPDQLLLSQMSGDLLYVDDTIHSVGAGSVKPRKHMPRRGLKPSS